MSVFQRCFQKPDNCNTYNMNDNPKNNIFMSENIRQKGLTILKYFDAYICHHYQPKNYVQLINELKSKFKMEVHLCHINMGINQITAVLLMLLGQN